ncbi:MAG: transketolase [Lentisphaerae bacterium]|nr:transketolase [Lentisphaerota bacterium]
MKDTAPTDIALTANTIRGLAMDGVQAANSGHPGMPMGMADVASVLFLGYLNHCSTNPKWINRDRFVLSAGHGSMLLYSLLHLSGYDLSLDDLRLFRQLDSKTPGHPEVGHTPGVETTTGPLGQGCANAVGMALAERMLAERFNTTAWNPINHYTYVICGDGDLMEGISHEALSLAGHLQLNKLILFYDSNRITIEGSANLSCSDNPKKRFQAYNWNVLEIDAHNLESIEKAIRKAKREKTRPTVIICHSHIGKGSPKMVDSHESHGAPLGVEEVKASKRNLGLPEDQTFYVPERVRELFAARSKKLHRKTAKWEKQFKQYCEANPDKASLWQTCFEDRFPADLADRLPKFDPAKAVATRSASGKVIQALAQALPQLVGGSADLAPSTKTLIDNAASIAPGSFAGRNLHFGIREHAMGAIMNGMALHGGFRVFGATFFVFSDYCRPAIRLAAIMKVPVIYVFTHDSFYVGEDGPTHQPVEHAAALRCIPNVTVLRPSDPTETAAAWIAALKNKTGPTAILLTRQNLDVIDRTVYPPAASLEKGAYILWQNSGSAPDLTLVASGSEVGLCLKAARELATNRCVRVVSMPSWELFDAQDSSYRASVIPVECPTLVVEAGVSMGWSRYVGKNSAFMTVETFGSSGPYKALEKKYGFTVEAVVANALKLLR